MQNRPREPSRLSRATKSTSAGEMDQSTSSALLSQPELSPLEQDVLDEYERLAENMKKVCFSAASPPPQPPKQAKNSQSDY